MLGLWFSILGLFFGFACSYYAKQKERSHKDWFMVGFLFSFIALGVIYFLPSAKKYNDKAKASDLLDEDLGLSTNY